jgi:hypothetical protein
MTVARTVLAEAFSARRRGLKDPEGPHISPMRNNRYAIVANLPEDEF